MLHARRAALFALLLALGGALIPAPSLARHSAQHRYLIEQKKRSDVPEQYATLTFAEFLALPARPGGYTAADWEGSLARTPRAVRLEGYIAEVISAPDGDFHVHLREQPQRGSYNQSVPCNMVRFFRGWPSSAGLDIRSRKQPMVSRKTLY